MSNDAFSEYKAYLRFQEEAKRSEESKMMAEGYSATIRNSASYQSDSTINYDRAPMAVKRKSAKKCAVTLEPNVSMHIGDIVGVLNETWLCMDIYRDQYDIGHGELWLCNQWFNYYDIDGDLKYLEPAILDDGSYSSNVEGAVPVTGNDFVCYMSLNDATKNLYVDKRLAIDVIMNSKGKEILDVGKIAWIDAKSKNFGTGSHLLMFGLVDDLYDEARDSVSEIICDCVCGDTDDDNTDNMFGSSLYITGRKTIKIGTTRSYSVSEILADGSTSEEIPNVKWAVDGCDEARIEVAGLAECKITIPLDDDLIGKTLKISCEDNTGRCAEAHMDVEVISIG